jgi:hypothetical protein
MSRLLAAGALQLCGAAATTQPKGVQQTGSSDSLLTGSTAAAPAASPSSHCQAGNKGNLSGTATMPRPVTHCIAGP